MLLHTGFIFLVVQIGLRRSRELGSMRLRLFQFSSACAASKDASKFAFFLSFCVLPVAESATIKEAK